MISCCRTSNLFTAFRLSIDPATGSTQLTRPVQPGEGQNLSHSPVTQQFRLRVQEAVTRARREPETDPRSPDCGDCRGCARAVR